MIGYVLRRLAWGLVALLGVTFLAFTVAYLVPGDAAQLLAGPNARPDDVANIRRQLGLDQPWLVQYAGFLWRLAHADLGRSYTGQPVAEIIAQHLPPTLLLAATGWICWLVFGVSLGALVAWRRNRAGDAALLVFSIVGASVPTFWVGVLLLYVFAVRLGWFPIGGSGSGRHLVLPTLTLAAAGVAYYARLAHAHLDETLTRDYVRTARAKGLPGPLVLGRHALRTALLPLVTIAGSDLAGLVGGVVFTESVFNWPGLGRLAVERMTQQDVPVILGVVLVSATAVVLLNLVIDLVYPLLDPRVRVGGAQEAG
ncbi:MAG: ABC transporter permease [Armatimonadetes bacterium]|nr:ABC transporter permease [Armatimonadota bacterium]